MNLLIDSESVIRSHQLKVSAAITIIIVAALVVAGSPIDNQYNDIQDFGYGYGYGYGYSSTTNTANTVSSGSNAGTYPLNYYELNQNHAAIEAMKKAEKEDARKRLMGVEPGEYGYHSTPSNPAGLYHKDIPITYTEIHETPAKEYPIIKKHATVYPDGTIINSDGSVIYPDITPTTKPNIFGVFCIATITLILVITGMFFLMRNKP